jgi:hypothetical protein
VDSETLPFGGRGVTTSDQTKCLDTLPVLEVQPSRSSRLVDPSLLATSSHADIP